MSQIESHPWLKALYRSKEECEAANMIHRPPRIPEPVAFGFLNPKWKKMCSLYQEGDIFVILRSPPESWQQMCGREVLHLVRNDQAIASILLQQN